MHASRARSARCPACPDRLRQLPLLVEFTREPDGHLGLLSLGMSMGQWLSLPMVIAGILLVRYSKRRPF